MTRAEKIAKRKARRNKRFQKRKEQLAQILYYVENKGVPMSSARCKVRHGYFSDWEDSDSPTGRSQVCDWQGTCQSPCNGDC